MPDEYDHAIAHALPETVASRLADLAHVPEISRVGFQELLAIAIVQARLGNEIVHSDMWPPTSASEISQSLKRVTVAARALDRALGAFFGEGSSFGKRNAAPFAGSLLENVLDDAAQPSEGAAGFLRRLTAYRHWLAILIAAAAETKRRAIDLFPTRRGRPSGAGGNPMFDNFVERLHEIARKTGGEWKHYRDPSSPDTIEWRGTLGPAMEILRPYLPDQGFFPPANLGRCLEHISGRFKTHTTNIDSAT
jgi:hypothetical protein